MFTRLVIGILSLFWVLGALSANENENRDETQAVVDRLQDFTRAFNRRDLNDVASFLSEDVALVFPTTGQEVVGKSATITFLRDKMQKLSGKNVLFKAGPVVFPQENTSIAEGVFQISDDKGNVQNQLARKFELEKQNGQWVIDIINEIDMDVPPSVYDHLKELEWLVGTWKDEDENVTIQYSTEWDTNRNFLLQNFTMDVYGLDAMEGIQIIGWDPIEKKIRSWIFDSDGGHGNGFWSRRGDSWYVPIHYLLSSGKQASAVNIYKKIDSQSYSYSSVDREVGGRKLPNIEPVTILKE